MTFYVYVLQLCSCILIAFCTEAQPRYTHMRAGFSIDAGGVAPVGAFSADIPFSYHKIGFWDIQAGLGLTRLDGSDASMAASTAITYNRILNGYQRNLCQPAPDYNRFEIYMETGTAVSFFNPKGYDYETTRLEKYALLPMAVLGLRIHYVSSRWIYTFKPRFTPFLVKDMPLWGGISLGMGWR